MLKKYAVMFHESGKNKVNTTVIIPACQPELSLYDGPGDEFYEVNRTLGLEKAVKKIYGKKAWFHIDRWAKENEGKQYGTVYERSESNDHSCDYLIKSKVAYIIEEAHSSYCQCIECHQTRDPKCQCIVCKKIILEKEGR